MDGGSICGAVKPGIANGTRQLLTRKLRYDGRRGVNVAQKPAQCEGLRLCLRVWWIGDIGQKFLWARQEARVVDSLSAAALCALLGAARVLSIAHLTQAFLGGVSGRGPGSSSFPGMAASGQRGSKHSQTEALLYALMLRTDAMGQAIASLKSQTPVTDEVPEE
ncbi:hypothetical protein NDU88_005165 [Pleurodeles waltl]|uniref:Uncharacterized protein n=1 Tax=Pleurodeles waltl TaxID=8319 RepID=A0AAV7L2B9_PLEWA|nr:hypothetical protein NDU88_005165 [Pleurodeles waltl]